MKKTWMVVQVLDEHYSEFDARYARKGDKWVKDSGSDGLPDVLDDVDRLFDEYVQVRIRVEQAEMDGEEEQ